MNSLGLLLSIVLRRAVRTLWINYTSFAMQAGSA